MERWGQVTLLSPPPFPESLWPKNDQWVSKLFPMKKLINYELEMQLIDSNYDFKYARYTNNYAHDLERSKRVHTYKLLSCELSAIPYNFHNYHKKWPKKDSGPF